jgi:hypothetical protein
VINLSPSSGTICNNTVSLTATGNGSTYSWYRNDVLIDGVTGTNYTATMAGNYKVTSSINGCTITSNLSLLGLNTIVSTSLIGDGVYCIGDLVDLRTTTMPDQQYTWYRNGTPVYGPIGGGNGGNQSLVVALTSSNDGAYYVVSAKSGCGDVTSNTVSVTEATVEGLFTSGICPDKVSFQWYQIAPGENYQFVVTQSSTPPSNPINPGTTSGITATVSSLNPSTLYYIHIRAARGPDYNTFCSTWTTISFTTLPLSGPFYWSGATNSDWFNPLNWDCEVVPQSISEVIINGGKPNYPTVTSNTTIKKLTVNTGATINVQPGVTLTITSQ